ncbi:MAG TPA: ATP-binding protein [Bryobacteraceae bacterium]|nr:ATP-binding protein [Bryobacteraceae bacterium]
MSLAILTVTIRRERDTVDARQRARQIARLLGFDAQDQTRISTAVSEIARNAFNYAGGGKVEYLIEGATAPQLFMIRISDQGPGVRDLDRILAGQYESRTGMGLGIIGARRLMDQFQIESEPGKGTTILLKKLFPRRAQLVRESDLPRIADALANERPQDPYEELQFQNRELLKALEVIRAGQAELVSLNRELEDTNRGVVALYAELDEKADHLRRADQIKTKFLSNMSHEFRSPLNSILALTGLLLDRSDGDLTGEQDQQVGYIRKAAQDLLELVNDLLDLAKVEAGKLEAKPIDFSVSALFAALRGMLRPLLLNQSVDLVFEDVAEIPPLYTDEGKISQILRNFISNALKFTERGEVRVSARLVGDADIEFSVTDTGIGIAPEHQELIFQDFVQLDNPVQRRYKGTGLGLPLSRRLATFLGGEVNVRSQPGAGSTFSVRVPMSYHDPAAEEAVAAEQWTAEPSSLPVLVVEDSPEMMMAYRSYLKGSGFQLVPASTTRQAEDALNRIQPAAVMLDIVLRSEDAWTFLAKFKEDIRYRQIPVLVGARSKTRPKPFNSGRMPTSLNPWVAPRCSPGFAN